jgi:uncharacterized membrane protein YfcA
MTLILLVAVGAAVAGFVQGLSGFAFGLIAMAFWVWVLPPQLAAPMVVFGSLIGQLIGLRSAWAGFRLGRALPFIAGGVVGVPIGVVLLGHIDTIWFRFAVGILLVVYCPLMLFASKLPRVAFGGKAADGLVGAVGGLMGGLGGLSGPAPTLWCTLRGWAKHEQRAVFQSFNLSMHVLTFAAYAASGTLTAETGAMFLIVVPAMIIPTLIGTRVYASIDDASFRRLVLVLLTVSGLTLLSAAVPELLA